MRLWLQELPGAQDRTHLHNGVPLPGHQEVSYLSPKDKMDALLFVENPEGKASTTLSTASKLPKYPSI